MEAIFEQAIAPDYKAALHKATSFRDIRNLFATFFNISMPHDPEAYKSDGSDYGLKISGMKTREKLNEQCKEILARVKQPEDLTPEDRAILLQYSGRGGTSDNSQWEYYTPTHVAQGIWDAMQSNGFENGNVLEPSCGAGVFLGTKPAGVIMSANDLDPTSSGVAALLNPGDYVSNSPFEEIVVNTADDTFDSCVGNVPFGRARGKSMSIDPAYKNMKRVEKYFLLRILDKIKPGGLACLVVPVNIIGDKQSEWKKFRTDISKKAEFLGAHKLPSGTFGAQGTDTVTDVIVLRKHGRELLNRINRDEIPTEILKEANVFWDEFISGKYWQGEGRPFIMGKYIPKNMKDFRPQEKVEGNIDNAAMRQKLAQEFHSRIKWDILNDAEPILRNYVDGDTKYINGEPHRYHNGEWVISEPIPESRDLNTRQFGASTLDELKALLEDLTGALDINCKQAYEVFNIYPYLMTQQQKDAVQLAYAQADEKVREQVYRGSIIGSLIAKMDVDEQHGEDVLLRRRALQNIVVKEMQRYGHPANNPSLALAGSSSRAFGVFMNCMDKNGQFSDLLAGTLDKTKAKGYQEDNISDIAAYLYNQKDGMVYFEDIKELYKGTIKLETLGDLADIDDIAISSDGTIHSMYCYCSGDVVPKMAALQEVIGKTDDSRLQTKFQKQIDLMNAKIQRVPLEDITFGLQQKWFSRQYILDFLHENGYPHAAFGKWGTEEYVNYDGETEKRRVFIEDVNNPDGEFRLYGLGSKKLEKFDLQFEKFLNGDNISGRTREDISEYKNDTQKMQDSFDSWMKQHPDSDDLAEKYTLNFNGYVKPEYDASPLDIDDIISGEIAPHAYQNAEVRRLSEQGCGICGFGTGLGKSFTALAMAAYNFKHGRAKRTCVVVPSAVLENWYHEARTFYSEAYMRSNILFVGLEPKFDEDGNIARKEILDENGSPKLGKDGNPLMQDIVRFAKNKNEIYEAMWKIPQSNYSLVVMTKEKFQSIPVRPDTMDIYMNDMVNRNLLSINDAENFSKKRKKSYADDVKKNKLEERFSNQGGKKKDELPYLEDMGFDSIITDESHFFKNSLSSGEKMGNVAGISSQNPADIAIDMSIKCDYMRRKNNGRGVYGLTATPVTNSPIEIFNMLSLVCPIEEFQKMGINTVDDFIRVFGKVEERERLKTSLEAEMKDTLVGFQNLQGLRNLFTKYVNIKTIEDVDDEIHVPNAENIEEDVELTDEQNDIYEALKKEAEESSKSGFKKDNDKRSIFSIMRDMDRLSTDYDLYKRQITFIFSKEHKPAIEKILPGLPGEFTVKEKQEFGSYVNVKYKFTPQLTDNGDTISLVVHEQHEGVVLKAMADAGIAENEVNHPIAPKYAKLLENLKKHLETNGKQIVFHDEKTQHGKLKRILVHNLPIDENFLGIINADEAKGDKLDKISKAYNAGEIKIVIANQKAEVGVNLQKGTMAIHHLTLPWTPASINQRNGRGVRQGNKVDTVQIYYYHGKGTFDAYRKQVLDNKANWIGQLLKGKVATAENADITAEEEMAAMVSGNIEEYRKAKADREEKRKNSENIQSINRLKILQSITNNLNTLEDRRLDAKIKIEREIDRLKDRITRLKQRGMPWETIKKSIDNLDKVKAKLTAIDEKFDAEKQKSESKRNQITGMLRQAAKKGELPFDETLINNPDNYIVTLKGELYAIGDCIEANGEFKRSNGYRAKLEGVYRINGINAQEKSLELEDLTGKTGNEWGIFAENLAETTKKVSFSVSEIDLKRLMAGRMRYVDLPQSGVTKEQFLENIGGINLDVRDGAVMADDTGRYFLINSPYDIHKGMMFVWPEATNEEFQKKVLTQWLNEQRESSYVRLDELCRSLFGNDFRDKALEYAHNATPMEINRIIGEEWSKIEKEYTDESFLERLLLMEPIAASKPFLDLKDGIFSRISLAGYDNKKDFEDAWERFQKEQLQDLRKMAIELDERRKNEAMQRKREHPDFREVPNEIQNRLNALNMRAYYNTEDTFLAYKNKSWTYKAFSRLFIQDGNGVGGKLYKSRGVLKAKFKAKYTTEWSEMAGSWWHVSAETNLEQLCAVLNA